MRWTSFNYYSDDLNLSRHNSAVEVMLHPYLTGVVGMLAVLPTAVDVCGSTHVWSNVCVPQNSSSVKYLNLLNDMQPGP